MIVLLFNSNNIAIAQLNDQMIQADKIEIDDEKFVATGNVQAQVQNYNVTANSIIYDIRNKVYTLEGQVTIEDYKLNAKYTAHYAMIDSINNDIVLNNVYGSLKNSHMAAKKIKYNNGLYESEFITTSLCNACKNDGLFWQIRAKKLQTNIHMQDELKLHDVYFDVFDKQVLHIPYFSIPSFWTGGKTGFLTPSIQANKGLGYQLQLPFYFYARKNLDFTFYPIIGKNFLYGMNMRHRLKNGGYEVTIYTGSLPFTKRDSLVKSTIFTVWPANIKINSNFLLSFQENTCPKVMNRAYEFGINGELALGVKPILLYKYDISDRKILSADMYGNIIYNRIFSSIDALYLHNLRLNTRVIGLPKINVFDVKSINLNNNMFSAKPVIMTHISTNSIHNENFSKVLSDAIGEVKFLAKHYLYKNQQLTYNLNFSAYQSVHNNVLYDHQNQMTKAALDVHWESKIHQKHQLFEPHIILHLESNTNAFYSVAQSQVNNSPSSFDALSIYSTTDTLNPNSIFSSNLYTTSARSILSKNGHHVDYGMIISNYHNIDNKFLLTLGGRQYIGKQSKFGNTKAYAQDISLASMQDRYREKYVSQFILEQNSFILTNRTWFTNNVNPTNNELYFDKRFNNLSTGVGFIIFNNKVNYNNLLLQQKFNKIVNANFKYKLTKNIQLGLNNEFRLGTNERGKPIQQMSELRAKVEYLNECIKVGFTVKKEFDKKGINSSVNSYNFYLKIPSIS